MPGSRPHVAIVGAGPAGSHLAYRLRSFGARVEIFDPSHPREKPCGGGLTARALALIPHAVGRLADPLWARTVRFVAPSGRSADIPLPEPLLIISRRELDATLLRVAVEAGAIHHAVRVSDVQADDASARLTLEDGRTIRCDLVVGADGATSLVRRRLARAFARAQLSIGAGYFAHDRRDVLIEIRAVVGLAGYIWSFPRADHLALGICAPADSASTAGLVDLLDRRSREQWLGGVRTGYAWPIPSLSRADLAGSACAGCRWALVGDAAGLVDPITREGIYYALHSAELLAACLATGPDTRAYAAALGKNTIPELAVAARWAKAFFRPRFLDELVRTIERSPAIRRVVGNLMCGSQDYRTLRRRLLATFDVPAMLGLARAEVAEWWAGRTAFSYLAK